MSMQLILSRVVACVIIVGQTNLFDITACAREQPLSPNVTVELSGFTTIGNQEEVIDASNSATDSLSQLRDDIDIWISDGIDETQFGKLARRTIDLAGATTDQGELLSILKQAARLCWSGPPDQARSLREFSLRQIVAMSSTSVRARTMLGTGFLPALHRIDEKKQIDEVQTFDQTVLALIGEGLDDNTLASLKYMIPLVRLEVNRAWNATWLNSMEREKTIKALRQIETEFGHVIAPDGESFSETCAEDIRELTELAFGSPVPEFVLRDLQNESLNLNDYSGEVVVLSFWSSWCVPCLEMVPHEKVMKDNFADDVFELIGVSSDDEAEKAVAAASKHEMTWRNVLDEKDGPASLGRYFRIRGLPSAIVIDAKGRIAGKFAGSVYNQPFSTADVQRVVEAALGKPVKENMVAGEFGFTPADEGETAQPEEREAIADGVPLNEDELKRYTRVAQQLVQAINTEDKEGYRALFTDEGWDNAIPWWREMFSNQIASFGRIDRAWLPRRGAVRIGEKMSFSGGIDMGATVMVRFEEGAGGALSFELNEDDKIILSNVYISREMAQYQDKDAKPIFELDK